MEKNYRPKKYMGVVKTYNKVKGFGFITCYDDGNDYFVHATRIANDEELIPNSIVEFELWEDRKDPTKLFAAKVLVCEVPEKRKY